MLLTRFTEVIVTLAGGVLVAALAVTGAAVATIIKDKIPAANFYFVFIDFFLSIGFLQIMCFDTLFPSEISTITSFKVSPDLENVYYNCDQLIKSESVVTLSFAGGTEKSKSRSIFPLLFLCTA